MSDRKPNPTSTDVATAGDTGVISPTRAYCLAEVRRLIPSRKRGKRVSLPTIYRWVNDGKLATVQIGGGRFVYGAELLRFMHAGAIATTATARPRAPRTMADRVALEQVNAILGV